MNEVVQAAHRCVALRARRAGEHGDPGDTASELRGHERKAHVNAQ
jgi:hypothetical protein